MKRFLMVCALLAGFASAATAQDFGTLYRSAAISQEGDQICWTASLAGDQPSGMASAAVKALTEFAQEVNEGQHLMSAGWTQATMGKKYDIKIVMSASAQTKPVLAAGMQSIAVKANCAVNSHLEIKAVPALVEKLKAMDEVQIAKLLKIEPKDADADTKALQQTFVQMTRIAAYAHSFPAQAQAKKIAFKRMVDGAMEFEVVFDQKLVDDQKVQAAAISAIRSSVQTSQQFPPKNLGI